MRAIDSRFTGAFYSMAYDYKYTLRQARKVIERETAHIITSHLTTNWNKVLPIIRHN
ncbi:P22AR C-terminal domain-containing protein [Gilliamella sp. Fer4-1]|uniref:P22AR C-terminal domain-containing protein n=1 Tax=Gilliamella sp. Fer4-1 TaxID=3120242 RepID=UPI003FA56E3D